VFFSRVSPGWLSVVVQVGTGFSEEALSELAQQLRPNQIDGPKAYYRRGFS
jgi:ATP-dependent DNA ligase